MHFSWYQVMDLSLERTPWQDKIVLFHLRGATGLGRSLDASDCLSRSIRMTHTLLQVPVLIFLVLEICGVILCLSSSETPLYQTVLHMVFGGLFVDNIVVYQTLLVHQPRLALSTIVNNKHEARRCDKGPYTPASYKQLLKEKHQ